MSQNRLAFARGKRRGSLVSYGHSLKQVDIEVADSTGIGTRLDTGTDAGADTKWREVGKMQRRARYSSVGLDQTRLL